MKIYSTPRTVFVVWQDGWTTIVNSRGCTISWGELDTEDLTEWVKKEATDESEHAG